MEFPVPVPAYCRSSGKRNGNDMTRRFFCDARLTDDALCI